MSLKKQNKCISCFECKTRVFRNEKELKIWCLEKEAFCRKNWIHTVQQKGRITLYWCTQLPRKPKMIFRTCDPPFIKNCIKNTLEIEMIKARKCDIWQVKSIMKGKTIHYGAPKQRRKALQIAQDLTTNPICQVVVEHYQTSKRIYDSEKVK